MGPLAFIKRFFETGANVLQATNTTSQAINDYCKVFRDNAKVARKISQQSIEERVIAGIKVQRAELAEDVIKANKKLEKLAKEHPEVFKQMFGNTSLETLTNGSTDELAKMYDLRPDGNNK